MARIPFPDGLEGTEDLPRTKKNLINCYKNPEGRIINRPGIDEVIEISGKLARGIFVWNNAVYMVFSQDLIKVTVPETGANETIGTILGPDVIAFAEGFNHIVVLVKGGAIYILDKANGISITSVGDNGSSVAVFNHGASSILTPVSGATLTTTGFVTNTDYNVSATVITSVYDAITTTAITSVVDNASVASFTHAGTSPSLGQEVTISDFVTETTYNQTGICTATTATTFEVSVSGTPIAFTNNDTGNFTATAAFLISSVAFGSDETTGIFKSVLTNITNNDNFVSCVDVAHKDSRFIYVPGDGSPVFFSDVGDAATVQVDAFFDAEVLPDKNNGVIVVKNELYITGTNSIEVFVNTGETPVPFQRRDGGSFDVGLRGGLIEYKEGFVFIGREKNQDAGIYVVKGGERLKISNEAVDEILSTYTPEELTEVIPGRVRWRGNDFATFTLRDDSLGYMNGKWFTLETVSGGTSAIWEAGFIAQFEGIYYTAFSDKIGRFRLHTNTDYGKKITREIVFGITQPDNDDFTAQSLTLGISQGFNDADGSVALFLSDDNLVYYDPVYRDTADLGEYDSKLEWNYPGGLGVFEGFLGIRLYTTQDIIFTSEYLIVNVEGKVQV